jgi:hypothetical protein
LQVPEGVVERFLVHEVAVGRSHVDDVWKQLPEAGSRLVLGDPSPGCRLTKLIRADDADLLGRN